MNANARVRFGLSAALLSVAGLVGGAVAVTAASPAPKSQGHLATTYEGAKTVGSVRGNTYEIAKTVGAVRGNTYEIAKTVGAVRGNTYEI